MSYGQVDTVWTRRYNGPADWNDTPSGIAVDQNGNIYVTGTSYEHGSSILSNYVTVKYAGNGDVLWSATYDGPWQDADKPIDILVDDSGNAYVSGFSIGFDATYDYATIKYASTGETLWVRRINGPWGDHDFTSSFTLDSSNNVYVTGVTRSAWTNKDYMTVKYNSAGDTLWMRLYNHVADNNDSATSVAVDQDGNVYVTGRSWDYATRYDCATVKYDTAGNEQWVSRYNGASDSTDVGIDVVADSAGNCYVTGASWSPTTNMDIVTIKYDAAGDTQWIRRYNGASNGKDFPIAIALSDAGNVYVTGYCSVGNFDYCTIEYDSAGHEDFVSVYNGPGDNNDMPHDMVLDDSGNVYVTGESFGSGTGIDYATVKYDLEGNEVWVVRYSSPGQSNDRAYGIVTDSVGFVYVTGECFGGGSTYLDYVTIKYSQSTGVTEHKIVDIEQRQLHATIMVGPLRLPEGKKRRVFDITGRIVIPYGIRPGIYFIEIDGKIAQKVVKIR
jgi:hypothetical protein